jgi:hypothetical protein
MSNKIEYPTEQEIIDCIMNCVDIRGINLSDYRANFLNENSGLYDSIMNIIKLKNNSEVK